MKSLRIGAVVLFVALVVFAAQPPSAALAGVTGSISSITFPGATATSCGSWFAQGIITVSPPGLVVSKITDGTGAIVGGFSKIAEPKTYSGVASAFHTNKPTKNPIRAVVFIDGIQIGNVTADNPCLPPSDYGPKFWDPGDDRLNRDPGQPAALYCRDEGVHIYSVNPDDSIGKIGLVVTKVDIDKVINSNPAANALIKQSADGKLQLYYLPATKELSFITHEARSGKQYSFVWKGLCR